jgi:hypothetical protein
MATRSGGFGATLNPFGTGTLSGFSQYDIGDNLADLEAYKAEVAWGNGQLSDSEYLAVLRSNVEKATEGTQAKLSAINKLDDATYRIGRSAAEANGLDSLIAFDQASLATMNPSNLRYTDVKASLDSELARRRSIDYSAMVEIYNAGGSSTESLLNWARTTLAGLPADAPDLDNWQSTVADLTARVETERDSTVYQEFQMGRMKPADFLAYLTGRRNSYAPESPQYADWSRRLEDAEKQVKQTALAAADAAFFDAYNAGQKSDASYLLYVRRRIDEMAPDDPDRPTWVARYKSASFSLAEDKLRFDVAHGKRPVLALVQFYDAYRKTLNPGSAEWRTATTKLEEAKRAQVSVSSGSGGGSGSGSTFNKYDPNKAVSPGSSLDTYLHQLTLTPHSSKAAVAIYNLNLNSIMNAKNDKVWLYTDPANPTAMTQRRNPNDTLVFDKAGKPVMVRGATYLAVESTALSRMLAIGGDYHSQLAEAALAKHDYTTYANQQRQANEAYDNARKANIRVGVDALHKQLDVIRRQIDSHKTIGDDKGVFNLTMQALGMVGALLTDPTIDDSRRDQLNGIAEKLASDPRIPDPTQGRLGLLDLPASGYNEATGQIEGEAVLGPGVHRIFNFDTRTGANSVDLVVDAGAPGDWDRAGHVPIAVKFGDRVVVAEAQAKIGSEIVPIIYVKLPDGEKAIALAGGKAYSVTYFDDSGKHTAYSLDGATWIRSNNGALPSITLNATLGKSRVDPATGATTWLDAKGNPVITISSDPSGRLVGQLDDSWVNDTPNGATWWGQNELGATPTRSFTPSGGYQPRSLLQDVGGPGQFMTLASVTSGGVLNMLPPSPDPGYYQPFAEAALETRRVAGLAVQLPATTGVRNEGSGLPSVQTTPTYVLPPPTIISPVVGFTIPNLASPAVNPYGSVGGSLYTPKPVTPTAIKKSVIPLPVALKPGISGTTITPQPVEVRTPPPLPTKLAPGPS